jgi:hypothetical protein
VFNAYALGPGQLPVPPRIECAQPGWLAVLRAKDWSASTTRTPFVYDLTSGSLQEKFLLPALDWQGVINRHPACVLDGDHSLYTIVKFDEKGDFQSGPYYLIQDRSSGRVANVTPDNADRLPAGSKANPHTGSPLYSDEQGLAFFVRDQQTGTLELWQGKRELKKAQTLPSTACVGSAFDNGRLTRVVVTNDGKAYAYVYKSGRLAPSSKFSKLAAILIKSKPNMLWASGCYMANNIVLWREEGTRLAFADASGNVFRPKSIDAIYTRTDGSPRAEKQSEKLLDNRSPLAEEGKSLPADVFSRSLLAVPFDDGSIAVIDCDYQRVIVVSSAN